MVFELIQFSELNFDKFYDSINLVGGEITWKTLNDVYDKEKNLQAII